MTTTLDITRILNPRFKLHSEELDKLVLAFMHHHQIYMSTVNETVLKNYAVHNAKTLFGIYDYDAFYTNIEEEYYSETPDRYLVKNRLELKWGDVTTHIFDYYQYPEDDDIKSYFHVRELIIDENDKWIGANDYCRIIENFEIEIQFDKHELTKYIKDALYLMQFSFNDIFHRTFLETIISIILNITNEHDLYVRCDSLNNTGKVIDRNELILDILTTDERLIKRFIATRCEVKVIELV